MARKSKIVTTMICEKCGDKPDGEKQGNWIVHNPICIKCGGKVKPNFE